MEIFEVYIRGEHGRAIGVYLTGSVTDALNEVDKYIRRGYEAWYEQIQ